MQKTNYQYEVLVGEDCSTDNTRAVLKEWEAQHPGFATIFYREHNMYHQEIDNGLDLFLRCRGKYIIYLEGDDFWTDEKKLDKQLTFLETHPEYLAVAHNCVVVGEDSQPIERQYPECRHNEYSLRDYNHGILPGQTATVMYRNIKQLPTFDSSFACAPNLVPGDRRLYFSLVTQGRVYCMQEKMSAYRFVTTHGSSFSATYHHTFEERERWLRKQLEFSYRIKKHAAIDVAKKAYVIFICAALRHHMISFKAFCSYSNVVKWRNVYFGWFFFHWLKILLFVKGKSK